MLGEYNKNSDLEKLKVLFGKIFIVYIVFNVLKELISCMQLVNVDIYFELQMYEGIVVSQSWYY